MMLLTHIIIKGKDLSSFLSGPGSTRNTQIIPYFTNPFSKAGPFETTQKDISPKGQLPVSMYVKLGTTLKVALMMSAIERLMMK